jgi:hypothetical protein
MTIKKFNLKFKNLKTKPLRVSEKPLWISVTFFLQKYTKFALL